MSTANDKARRDAARRTGAMICKYVEHLCAVQAHQRFTTSLKSCNRLVQTSLEFFTAVCEPSISFLDYATHVAARAKCSPECYIFALAYLRRVAHAGFPVTTLTIHRLFITAVVIAIKIRDDFFQSMSFYASVGGIETRDLASMERHFLFDLIGYRGEVLVDEYFSTCLEITAAGQEVPKSEPRKLDVDQGGVASDSESHGLSRNTSAGSGRKSPPPKQLTVRPSEGLRASSCKAQQQRLTSFALRRNLPQHKQEDSSTDAQFPVEEGSFQTTTSKTTVRQNHKGSTQNVVIECAKMKLMKEWARDCNIFVP